MGADYIGTQCPLPIFVDGSLVSLTEHEALLQDRFVSVVFAMAYDVNAFEELPDPESSRSDFLLDASAIFFEKLAELNDALGARDTAITTINGLPWIETGGMSWGDEPTESFACIEFFAQLGIFNDPFVDPNAEITALLDRIDQHDLDDLVHDLKSQEASRINNEGQDAQLLYIARVIGTDGLREELNRLAS